MTNGMIIQSTLSVQLDDLTLAYLSRFPRNFLFDVADVELQQHLASGGGGAVHLARIKSQDRFVAAKIFRDADSIRKTIDECERAIKLHHKNIVQHVGLTVSKSAFSTDLVLLMELGEGSLQDALRSGQGALQFSFDKVYDFMKQVAAGIMYIHQKGMLWLDGKPGNLLFFENRTKLKLIDFGLSRDVSKDKTHDTVTRAGAGTLRYMSKNQLNENQVRPVDDIYSFGATFFNLVCGVEPWAAASMPQIMTGNLIDHFTPRTGCPLVLEQVVKACLAVDPNERPQNGTELMRLLLPEDEEMPQGNSMPPSMSTDQTSSSHDNNDNRNHGDDVTEQIDMNVTW
jgi:serine/threonine protein kinase